MHTKRSAKYFIAKNFFSSDNRTALAIWIAVALIFILIKSIPMQARYNEETDVPVNINRAPLLIDSRSCIWLVQDTNNGPKLVELESPCKKTTAHNA